MSDNTEEFFFASFSHLASLRAIEALTQSSPWSESAFAAEISAPHSKVLILKVDGEVVGFLCFRLVVDELFILNFSVGPKFQGRGLGKSLLERALNWSRARGAAWATLEVRRSNERAIALYGGFGFEEIGERKAYYSDNGEDALVLSLELRERSVANA